MGKLFIRIRQLILITGDLVLLFSSLFLMLLLRYGNLPTEDLLQSHITPFAVLFLLWLLVFFVNGLYDLPLAKNEIQFYKRLFQAVGVNFLISMVFFYIIPFFQIAPKTNLVIVIVIFTLLEFLWRSVFNSIILPHALLNSVLFIGDITKLPELKLALNRKSGLGYSLIAIISPEQNTQEALKNEGIECYKDLGRIRSIVNIHNINTVILGPEFAQNSNVQKELYELIFWGTDIVEWSRTYEELLGRVPVQVLGKPTKK
jgi:FlaA1/EpsC-like NDP-sugar epimerase